MSDDELAELMQQRMHVTPGTFGAKVRAALDVAECEIRKRVLGEVIDRLGRVPAHQVARAKVQFMLDTGA